MDVGLRFGILKLASAYLAPPGAGEVKTQFFHRVRRDNTIDVGKHDEFVY